MRKRTKSGAAPPKRKRATAKKSARSKAAPAGRDALEDYIAAAARALNLPVAPAWRPAIKTNLAVTLQLAALYADFPLPDDAEPAPVFTA
jgi:hypothetical protein